MIIEGPDQVTAGGAGRDRARARPALPRGHDGAGQAPACLHPRGEADRGGIPPGLRHHQRDRPELQFASTTRRCWRPARSASRRWSACSTTATTARPRPPRTCSARSGGSIRRAPRTAARSSARRRRGRSCSVNILGQGPRRQAGRRRRGRRLAVLDRGPLREPGPDPGRHEPARQVHHRRRRPLRVPQHQAGGLSDPDRRAGRRSVQGAGPPQHAAGASALPDLQAGLQDPHLAGLSAGRSEHRDRRAVRRDAGGCSATTCATRTRSRRRRA